MSEYLKYYNQTEKNLFEYLFSSEDSNYVNMYITGRKTFPPSTMELIFEIITNQETFLKEMKNKYSK